MAERYQVPGATPSACLDPGASLLGLVGDGLRATSAEIYRRDVADFLRWWDRDPAGASPADIGRYLAARAPTPSGADRRLAALAHFYRAGIGAGCWATDPTLDVARARRGPWRTGRRR